MLKISTFNENQNFTFYPVLLYLVLTFLKLVTLPWWLWNGEPLWCVAGSAGVCTFVCGEEFRTGENFLWNGIGGQECLLLWAGDERGSFPVFAELFAKLKNSGKLSCWLGISG